MVIINCIFRAAGCKRPCLTSLTSSQKKSPKLDESDRLKTWKLTLKYCGNGSTVIAIIIDVRYSVCNRLVLFFPGVTYGNTVAKRGPITDADSEPQKAVICGRIQQTSIIMGMAVQART